MMRTPMTKMELELVLGAMRESVKANSPTSYSTVECLLSFGTAGFEEETA
jgi:hypothetical protein